MKAGIRGFATVSVAFGRVGRIQMGNPGYYLPGDLEARIDASVEHHNHRRYHESLGDLTPADVHFGRGQTILLERERIRRRTIQHRRLIHRQQAA